MFKTASALVMALLALLAGCSRETPDSKEQPLSSTGFMLDTVITITLYDGQDQDVLDGAFELCSHYENMFSKTIEGSDVWNINTAGGSPVEVSDETAELMALAVEYSELTNGAFDVTIAPVSALWDFTSGAAVLPDAQAISAAAALVDYRAITIDGNTVTLTNPEAGIDLGGIAKGYIADRIADYLLKNNVTSATINLGGNVYALGSKEAGEPWTVGLQDPFGRTQSSIAAVRVVNKSVVTSGIYERYFTIGEELYHHILDPETGYPINNDLTAVTIISDRSVDGDALSTSCYVLGLEKGLELIESIDGVEAVFIDENEQAHFSSGVGDGGIEYISLAN